MLRLRRNKRMSVISVDVLNKKSIFTNASLVKVKSAFFVLICYCYTIRPNKRNNLCSV